MLFRSVYLSSSVLVSYYTKNDKGIKYFSIHQSLHLSLCRNLVSTPKMGPVETSSPRYLPLHIHDTSNAKCRIQESSVVLKDGPISDLFSSLPSTTHSRHIKGKMQKSGIQCCFKRWAHFRPLLLSGLHQNVSNAFGKMQKSGIQCCFKRWAHLRPLLLSGLHQKCVECL